MAVVQSIQSRQFALELRPSQTDLATERAAALAVCGLALRADTTPQHVAAREALDALGLTKLLREARECELLRAASD